MNGGRGAIGIGGWAATLAAILAACSPWGSRVPDRPPVEIPETFRIERPATAPLPDRWWEALGDPALAGLVDRALAANLDLRGARARVAQARAAAEQAGAARWPGLSLQGQASRQRQRFDLGDRTFVFVDDTFAASAAARWEVDVWARAGSEAESAELQAEAARAESRAAAVSVAAAVADGWFDLVHGRALVALLEEQLEVDEAYLELVVLRYREGLVPALDVQQQRQQTAAGRAQLVQAEARRSLAADRLAVLLGEGPRTFEAPDGADLPPLPPLPETGVPAALLERRPDLVAARRRVEAADRRVAAALSARLPSFSLTGDFGYRSQELGELLDTEVWSFGGAVALPIFEGGRIAGRIDEARAVLAEAVAAWGQAFLDAVREVEAALVSERTALAALEAQEEVVEAAQAALREATARYREGLTDYLQVFTAIQAAQRAEVDLLAARRELLAHRVSLHRALGGIGFPAEER